MSTEGKRVVLVKPGDVLLIGGAALLQDEVHEAVGAFFAAAGIEVMVFGSDIEIGSGCLREVEAERDRLRDERDTMADLLHVRRDDDGNLLGVAIPDYAHETDARVAVMLEASREKLGRIRAALGVPQEASLPEAARTYRELAEQQAGELAELRNEKSLDKQFGDRFGRYLRLLDFGLPGDKAWEASEAEPRRG